MSPHVKHFNQPTQKPDIFKNKLYLDEKLKVHVENFSSHAKNQIEERGVEVITQPIDSPIETWRGTFLDQEEEIISEFLLSLQLEDLSQVSPFDDNLILHRDEKKMPLDETPHADFLLMENRYEADFQHGGDPAGMLKDTLLNEE